MIGVTIRDDIDPGVSVTLKWCGARIKMESEGGTRLPGDLDLDPGDLLDALTVLAMQRHDRHVGPSTTLVVLRDQLTDQSEGDDE